MRKREKLHPAPLGQSTRFCSVFLEVPLANFSLPGSTVADNLHTGPAKKTLGTDLMPHSVHYISCLNSHEARGGL